MGQTVLKLSVVLLMGVGTTFIYKAWKNSSDPCEISQLQTSKTEIDSKDRGRMKLHLGSGFGKKLKRFLRHVVKVETKSFYKPRYKMKPSMVSVTTEFKSQKVAQSAYRYMKRKWEGKKDGQHEVALKDKSVIWYRNSNATAQCFADAAAKSKQQLGVKEVKEERKYAATNKGKK